VIGGLGREQILRSGLGIKCCRPLCHSPFYLSWVSSRDSQHITLGQTCCLLILNGTGKSTEGTSGERNKFWGLGWIWG